MRAEKKKVCALLLPWRSVQIVAHIRRWLLVLLAADLLCLKESGVALLVALLTESGVVPLMPLLQDLATSSQSRARCTSACRNMTHAKQVVCSPALLEPAYIGSFLRFARCQREPCYGNVTLDSYNACALTLARECDAPCPCVTGVMRLASALPSKWKLQVSAANWTHSCTIVCCAVTLDMATCSCNRCVHQRVPAIMGACQLSCTYVFGVTLLVLPCCSPIAADLARYCRDVVCYVSCQTFSGVAHSVSSCQAYGCDSDSISFVMRARENALSMDVSLARQGIIPNAPHHPPRPHMHSHFATRAATISPVPPLIPYVRADRVGEARNPGPPNTRVRIRGKTKVPPEDFVEGLQTPPVAQALSAVVLTSQSVAHMSKVVENFVSTPPGPDGA
eukprot:6491927-Amphidinium_carterae.4